MYVYVYVYMYVYVYVHMYVCIYAAPGDLREEARQARQARRNY